MLSSCLMDINLWAENACKKKVLYSKTIIPHASCFHSVNSTNTKAPKKTYNAWHKLTVHFTTDILMEVSEEFLDRICAPFGEIGDTVVRSHVPMNPPEVGIVGYAVVFYTIGTSAQKACDYLNKSTINHVTFNCSVNNNGHIIAAPQVVVPRTRNTHVPEERSISTSPSNGYNYHSSGKQYNSIDEFATAMAQNGFAKSSSPKYQSFGLECHPFIGADESKSSSCPPMTFLPPGKPSPRIQSFQQYQAPLQLQSKYDGSLIGRDHQRGYVQQPCFSLEASQPKLDSVRYNMDSEKSLGNPFFAFGGQPINTNLHNVVSNPIAVSSPSSAISRSLFNSEDKSWFGNSSSLGASQSTTSMDSSDFFANPPPYPSESPISLLDLVAQSQAQLSQANKLQSFPQSSGSLWPPMTSFSSSMTSDDSYDEDAERLSGEKFLFS